jgi:hypothetical protein
VDAFWASWKKYAEKLVKRTYEKCSKPGESKDLNHDPVRMLSQAYAYVDECTPNDSGRDGALSIIEMEKEAVSALQKWLKSHPEHVRVPSTSAEFTLLQSVLEAIKLAPFLKKAKKFKSHIGRVKLLFKRISSDLDKCE